MRYKRCPFCHFAVLDDTIVDLYALFRGEYRSAKQSRLFALSPLSGAKAAVSVSELESLTGLPADAWTPEEEISGIDSERLSDLSFQGVLLSDHGDPVLTRFRRRSALLEKEQWHPQAALFHFMARGLEDWEHEETPDYEALELLSAQNARDFVAEHGPPPEPFHSVSERPGISLPWSPREGAFYDVLLSRRTTRVFDIDRPLPLNDLATMLHYVFGWQGQTRISPEILLLHRTSPSGGARHPIEAYVLAQNVENLPTGLYHYRSHEHSLDPVQRMSSKEARELAVGISAGQSYVGGMHVVVILTARFYRNQWKYRRNMHTYRVSMMDAAHLSQTFYLVATELGLGAFFSAAINAPMIEENLGINGFEEGALGLCGCGIKVGQGKGELPFEPYLLPQAEPS